MTKRNKKQFNALAMRNILIALVVIVFAGLVGGFYYFYEQLKDQSSEVSATLTRLADTGAMPQATTDHSQLQAELDRNRGVIEKLNRLSIPSSNLQSQTIQDINRYSKASGIAVENYTFGPTADNSNLQPNDVTVILKNPINYENLIRFMRLIETNLPKMQIQGVSITSGGDGQDVTVRQLVIGVTAR